MSTDSFFGETLRLALLLFRTVFQPLAPRYETQSLLAHLVKGEVVPFYHMILINMEVGNPTMSFA